MTQVPRDEFFRAIGPLNVHPEIVGRYPYTSIFRTPDRTEVGRIENGETGQEAKYFLARPADQSLVNPS